VVFCVADPTLSSCAKAALTVALVVATGGGGEADESEILLEGRKDRGLEGDAAVTFRKVTPDEVLAALGDGGEDQLLGLTLIMRASTSWFT
jgi:hypothetical protein